MRNPQMYPASWESRAFTQWPTRQQKGPRLQETPRVEESSQLQEASRTEGLQLQEDTPTGNRQVGEGETMQVVDAADEAAAGEPPKM